MYGQAAGDEGAPGGGAMPVYIVSVEYDPFPRQGGNVGGHARRGQPTVEAYIMMAQVILQAAIEGV